MAILEYTGLGLNAVHFSINLFSASLFQFRKSCGVPATVPSWHCVMGIGNASTFWKPAGSTVTLWHVRGHVLVKFLQVTLKDSVTANHRVLPTKASQSVIAVQAPLITPVSLYGTCALMVSWKHSLELCVCWIYDNRTGKFIGKVLFGL